MCIATHETYVLGIEVKIYAGSREVIWLGQIVTCFIYHYDMIKTQ